MDASTISTQLIPITKQIVRSQKKQQKQTNKQKTTTETTTTSTTKKVENEAFHLFVWITSLEIYPFTKHNTHAPQKKHKKNNYWKPQQQQQRHQRKKKKKSTLQMVSSVCILQWIIVLSWRTCYAYCQGFLPCLFLPFRSSRLHFFQKLSRLFLCWLWLTHGSCVGSQNKIGHPPGCSFPCWVPTEYK